VSISSGYHGKFCIIYQSDSFVVGEDRDVIREPFMKSSSLRVTPQLLVTGLAGALMAYLTLIPLLMLVYGSLKSR